MSLSNQGLVTLRERIFFNHESPTNRTITDEITLLNKSPTEIPSIFITKSEFMVGLKIFDESNRELSFYTNQLTRDLIEDVGQYQEILDEINAQRAFVVWIRLPKGEEICSFQTKIIKLVYKNRTYVKNYKKTNVRKLLIKSRLFFSLPTFPITYLKPKGIKHDVFYIIQVPDRYKIDFEILEKYKVNKNGNLEELDKVYTDGHDNTISIRIPSTDEPIRFQMVYDVNPQTNEKIFYISLLLALIGLSILFLFLNLKLLDTGWLNIYGTLPLKQIFNHINPLLGGIVTTSSVIIGFMRGYSTDKTRFWFLIPIFLSAIAFVSKV